eukprot:CAMPEP_0172715812 /NCGR_PEP_ID=MMETSP1074-20121228/67760_1 /TAXON_ID=2916 /ORGANISM="Ceratium fusus, Strain PA161109" /LENGTH=253 /DNA_ID=CAMNT_0013540429 /DNA_START=60 /DNA_END=819 /DNA_ORIENTATION=-
MAEAPVAHRLFALCALLKLLTQGVEATVEGAFSNSWALPIQPPPKVVDFSERLLGNFLENNYGNAFGVILGVGNGRRALELLETWPHGVLFLVDPYIHLRRGYERPENLQDDAHQRQYEDLRNYLYDAPGLQGRYSFAREFSFAVPHAWREKQWGPDPRFVLLDANPSYGATRTDLLAWWPMLAEGGMMAGTNYSTLGDGSVVGVRRAVDEFAVQQGLQLFITNDPQEPAWILLKEGGNGDVGTSAAADSNSP